MHTDDDEVDMRLVALMSEHERADLNLSWVYRIVMISVAFFGILLGYFLIFTD